MTEGVAAAKAAGVGKGRPSAAEEGDGETVLLLNGSLHLPSDAASGSGEQSAGRPAGGLRQGTLEMDSSAATVDGDAVLARVSYHILPLFFSLALLNSIDRANLSFAAVQLNADLGFSRSVYGFGSGLFFVGYAVLQVVAPLLCARVGAPTFLGAILGLWGGVTLLFAFMRTAGQFYFLRLLLGVAESGAYPGMWFHLALFFDDHELGLAYTCVATATSLAGLLGAPLAAGLLLLDGVCGLRGWQWLFLVESAPAVALGVVIRWRLARSPEAAVFLRPAERRWLVVRKGQQAAAPAQAHLGDGLAAPPLAGAAAREGVWAPLRAAFASRHMWHLSGVWTLNAMGMDGIVFWAPLLVRAILDEDVAAPDNGSTEVAASGAASAGGDEHLALGRMVQAALLAGVPFGAAAIAMVVNARHAKRCGERHWHGVLPLLLGAASLAALAALMGSSGNGAAGAAGAFVALTAAAMGIWSVHGPLMGWPAAFLSGSSAASGFALMKMVGTLGSFLGPALIGALADATGGFAAPCLVLGVCLAAGAVLMLAFRPPGGPAAACPTWLASLSRAIQRRRRALWLGKRSRSDSSVAEAGVRQGTGSGAGEDGLRRQGAESGLVPLQAEQPVRAGIVQLREGASS